MSDDNVFKLTSPLPAAQGKAENDHWPTPPKLAEAIVNEAIQVLPDPGSPMIVCEPGCGDRAPFITAVPRLGFDAILYGLDFRDILLPDRLIKKPNRLMWLPECDFLRWTQPMDTKPDLIVTNPPFSLAQEFVEHAIDVVKPTGIVVMLLQTGFEGAVSRREFWDMHRPFKRMLIRPRPSFGGGSDSREYAAYFWAGRTLDTFLHQIGKVDCQWGYIDNEGPWGKV